MERMKTKKSILKQKDHKVRQMKYQMNKENTHPVVMNINIQRNHLDQKITN